MWARDEITGEMGWKEVLAHYSNRYEETVHVTAIDDEGKRQTITSNRIHPYFARVAAGLILTTANIVGTPAIASEGHIYSGDIAGGAWVDAQDLKIGDELLSTDDTWQTVVEVTVEAEPLQAFNLTVDEYSTYFVAGDQLSDAVWVHNECYRGYRPDGYVDTPEVTAFGQRIIRHTDDDGNVRDLYQGHPPNDDNWYSFDDSNPPTPRPATDNPVLDALSPTDREMAIAYAEGVNSDDPFYWNTVAPDATTTQKNRWRQAARDAGLVPVVPIDPVTKFPDFTGYVLDTQPLPAHLWDKSRREHFRYLNDMFYDGVQPPGTVWHHHQDSGLMELVPRSVHNYINHKGGCTTWATGC